MTSTLFLLLLVLACPVGMWLMMRGGHGGHAGDGMQRHRAPGSVHDLRRQREELDREIASRERR